MSMAFNSELSAEDARLSRCQGKKSFVRWSDATKRAALMTHRDNTNRFFAPYRCRDCGQIHIGSRNKDQQRVTRLDRVARRRHRRGEE